ncbi:xanthine dehydrogenase accessory factor [Streptomyces sp. DSM 42143]|uniref:XdhC family protein n=1 Tax=Streptomyces sp. DSM 42143 TaxID=2817711 RepID=UPI00277E0E03|nr:XdhC family protein [Streptomyces sp. DSM 42143]MDQ0383190.1 xanthine dehydrogenase accessory factor [Streptomyces sp. DSM 42143]
MRDILDQVIAWHRQGAACALATVVRTRGSAPRPVGTAMAVAESGEVAGSLSGGCVEGAVYESAREVLATGRTVIESYGIADQDAFAAGLTCGGEMDVHVRPLSGTDCAVLQELVALCAAEQPAALVVPLDESAGQESWRLTSPDRPLAGKLGDGAREALLDGMPRVLAGDGSHAACKNVGATYLVLPFAPRPRMIVAGATDFAGALTRIGAFLGYRVILCDARPAFTTDERFPHADEVVVDWPHRHLEKLASTSSGIDTRTAICILTHDPKFDVPALLQALRSRAGYVGAMGSRRAHLDRLQRLREAGATERELSRLHSPIGLDLGARSPEETAVSIAAEIVASRWGRSGAPLGRTSTPIHPGRPGSAQVTSSPAAP